MQSFQGIGGKLDKLLASPIPNTAERSMISKNKTGLKRINPDRDMGINVKATTMSNSGVACERSPFRTPPSLSYCPDKVI